MGLTMARVLIYSAGIAGGTPERAGPTSSRLVLEPGR